MAAKDWRLVVTELGGSTPLNEVTIQADNWMMALRRGRKQLGERGGVPTGSSCAVDPDGKVTILDPVDRRQFVLTPHAEGAADAPVPVAPEPAPKAAAPKTAAPKTAQSAPKASSAAPGTPAVSAAAPTTPKASTSKSSTKPATNGAAKPNGGKPKRRAAAATMAYVPPAAVEAVKREIAVGKSEPAKSEPAAPAKSTAKAKKSVPQKRTSFPPPAEPMLKSEKAKSLKAKSLKPKSLKPKSLKPKPVKADAPTSSKAKASQDDQGFKLLHERSEEPTKQRPIAYRERTLCVDAGTSKTSAELIARVQLDDIREGLKDKPKGKLIRIAVFDHPWTERPETPPVVTLEWKDWRNELNVAYPLEALPAPKSRRSTGDQAMPIGPTTDEVIAEVGIPESAVPDAASEPSAPLELTVPKAAPAPIVQSAVAVVGATAVGKTATVSTPPKPALELQEAEADVAADKVVVDKAAADKAAADKAAADKAAADKAAADKAAADKAAADKAAADKAAADKADAEQAAAEDDDDLVIADVPVAPARKRERRRTTSDHDSRLATAFEACQDLLFLETPIEGLEFTIRLLSELIPSEAAAICLYDINNDELRFVVADGPAADRRRGNAVNPRQGLFGESLALIGRPFLGTPKHASFTAEVDGRDGVDVKSAMYMALFHQGRLLGVVQQLNSLSNDGIFEAPEADLLAYIGNALAEFLYQARIREKPKN